MLLFILSFFSQDCEVLALEVSLYEHPHLAKKFIAHFIARFLSDKTSDKSILQAIKKQIPSTNQENLP
jgi:hypothetical protein